MGRVTRDLFKLLLLMLVVFAVSVRMDVFERLREFADRHEGLYLDEICIVLMMLPLALGVFSFRRWRELKREMRERVAVEARLIEAKEAAEHANRAKDEFLANMSHEIRTPMNGVLGMTELLLETRVNPEQQEYLEAVKSSADALLSVINDVLDYSQIEAGKLRFNPAVFDLPQVLQDVVKAVSLRAHQKGLELLLDASPDLPEYMEGDPFRLRQVLLNLVGNAIKFTEHGEVLLSVRKESLTGQELVLRFSVSDTGEGVPREKREEIFEPFTQVDGGITRRHGGTGLGLTISRRLVQAMGGRIWVESTEGGGSTFHFTGVFALTAPLAAGEALPAPERMQGLRTLIVDDNSSSRHILLGLAGGFGCEAVAASSAEEALDTLRLAASAGRPIQLVLSDALMPGMDGFTLAEQIKMETGTAPAMVIMLNSTDRRVDLDRLRALGISAYIMKPATRSGLMQVVASAVEQSARPATGAVQAPPPGTRPLRILLAEDNAVNQRLAAHVLRRGGHWVAVAETGRQAVEMAANSVFDLALMDINMPEMDGLTATRSIRAREGDSGVHLPVIAMTACAMQGDRERCLRAGMDDYLAKPISPHELIKKVNALTHAPVPPANGTAG